MYRKNSLGNNLLLILEKSIDGYCRLEDFTYHHYAYFYDRPLKKSVLALAIKRLREKGLVDYTDETKLAIKLTDKGLEKTVVAKLNQDDEKWDGRWRIVIFDIPEKRRLARDLLRLRLKSWGFKHLQKSVWVSKKNCTNTLRDYIKQVGIQDWVMVIESDNVDF